MNPAMSGERGVESERKRRGNKEMNQEPRDQKSAQEPREFI